METARRSLWDEPRPAGAPPAGRLDWLLAVGVVVVALVESIVRTDLTARPLALVLVVVLAPALLFRRQQPLVATLVGFSCAALLSTVQWVIDSGDLGFHVMMTVLLLPYALVRWGSGREVGVGLAFVSAVVALGMYVSAAGWADLLGGSVLILSIVTLGVVFRHRAEVWDRQRRAIRNEERVALARELHDSVAHHVSAIAIQAQAGGAVARAQPEVAARVLTAIEQEASRTLAEMRSMVRVLRDEVDVDLTPAPGIDDLRALARTDTVPTVDVHLTGALTPARPVGTAVYRLAQEALTNARRHARDATRIAIDVRRDGDMLRLRVHDDGRVDSAEPTTAGFGLLGMTERAALLGGTLHAGPGADGGWLVEAVLPMGERP